MVWEFPAVSQTRVEFWNEAQYTQSGMWWFTLFFGFFGLHHLYLRSPQTALIYFIANCISLGYPWIYDLVQLSSGGGENLSSLNKHGLAHPWGALGLAQGMWKEKSEFSFTQSVKSSITRSITPSKSHSKAPSKGSPSSFPGLSVPGLSVPGLSVPALPSFLGGKKGAVPAPGSGPSGSGTSGTGPSGPSGPTGTTGAGPTGLSGPVPNIQSNVSNNPNVPNNPNMPNNSGPGPNGPGPNGPGPNGPGPNIPVNANASTNANTPANTPAVPNVPNAPAVPNTPAVPAVPNVPNTSAKANAPVNVPKDPKVQSGGGMDGPPNPIWFLLYALTIPVAPLAQLIAGDTNNAVSRFLDLTIIPLGFLFYYCAMIYDYIILFIFPADLLVAGSKRFFPFTYLGMDADAHSERLTGVSEIIPCPSEGIITTLLRISLPFLTTFYPPLGLAIESALAARDTVVTTTIAVKENVIDKGVEAIDIATKVGKLSESIQQPSTPSAPSKGSTPSTPSKGSKGSKGSNPKMVGGAMETFSTLDYAALSSLGAVILGGFILSANRSLNASNDTPPDPRTIRNYV